MNKTTIGLGIITLATAGVIIIAQSAYIKKLQEDISGKETKLKVFAKYLNKAIERLPSDGVWDLYVESFVDEAQMIADLGK